MGCMQAAQKELDCNLITFRVENAASLTKEGVLSPVKLIKNFPWRLLVRLNEQSEEPGKYTVGLYCNCDMSSLSDIWHCTSEFTLTLVNQRERTANIDHHLTRDFVASGLGVTPPMWGIINVIDLDDILNEEKGFIKDGAILVEARITITSVGGEKFRKKAKLDFFSPAPYFDGILLVDGKKVHVSKQYLAISSPVFHSMFYKDFKEKDQSEIELKDVNLETFLTVLGLLYTSAGAIVTVKNVEMVLELADRFDIKTVTDKAEWYLNESNRISLTTKCRIADRFRLANCKKFNFDHIRSDKFTVEELKKMRESEDFHSFSQELIILLLDRSLEMASMKVA